MEFIQISVPIFVQRRVTMLPSLKDGALLSLHGVGISASSRFCYGRFCDGLVPPEVNVIGQEAHRQSLHRDNTDFEDHPTP